MAQFLVTPVEFCFDSRLMEYEVLEACRLHADSLLKTLCWKSTRSKDYPLIVCLMGGTGTGKSTIFNSLAGRKISKVGVQRPCTHQAILLVHEDFVAHLDHLPCFEREHRNDIAIFPHHWPDLKHLIFVDTPDFDSVESANRLIAERFFILSDILILMTSQEKYADLLSRDLTNRARAWGKKTMFLMNKAVSDEAFDDYRNSLHHQGEYSEPVRVRRINPSPEYIDGLRHWPQFAGLFDYRFFTGEVEKIREHECKQLRGRTIAALLDLENRISEVERRIISANSSIDEIFSLVSKDMEKRLEIVLSTDLETQIRNRLEGFLRKYDILFVPRMMIRKTIGKVVSGIQDFFVSSMGRSPNLDHKKTILIQDIEPALDAARLQPLEEAIAKFNLRTAEFLSEGPGLADLFHVAKESVPRFNSENIRSLYEQAFPGIERLIEAEVDRFKQGLTKVDEIKLYGSYTLWALLLVTVELAVGGGFTVLDALLNTVIMPFIPSWLLKLKVIDLLREIGERADAGHREAVREILENQAQLYKNQFLSLLPDQQALNELRSAQESLGISTRENERLHVD